MTHELNERFPEVPGHVWRAVMGALDILYQGVFPKGMAADLLAGGKRGLESLRDVCRLYGFGIPRGRAAVRLGSPYKGRKVRRP